MKLADRLAQSRIPFMVQECRTGSARKLNSSADCADDITRCPLRFVLCDELTRLCTALAYSKGARTLECADLLRVPSTLLWVEWCDIPWRRELAQYGFASHDQRSGGGGRRGILIRSSLDGRRGTIRTFWADASDAEVLASSIEAYFDLDVSPDEEPDAPDGHASSTLRVFDHAQKGEDILRRCFRFRYERTWGAYYDQNDLTPVQREALARHALGTIAIDIPVVLVFLLLLATRSSLPRRTETFARLNRSRLRAGKPPLLEHVEVNSPWIPDFQRVDPTHPASARRSPRLHHVRGHLFRRGNELFWRVPHLRGTARSGKVFTRTVTWTFEKNAPIPLRF